MKDRMDLAHSFLFPRIRHRYRGYLRCDTRVFPGDFSRYELLFETVTADEAYFVKPNSLRHPLIFYFGHTATFFINKLLLAGLLVERIDPEFEAMFAVGVDCSARFIHLGVQFAQTGSIGYSLVDEGELTTYKTRDLASLGLGAAGDKVQFLQGDACNLHSERHDFDLILAANLIDRLYEPARFLNAVHQRLQPGGVLLIASPYTWLEEHTLRPNWIGGYKKDTENFTTLDGLKALLSSRFRLLAAPQDVPFVIRETRRKFQHSWSEVTLWERVA